VNVTELSAARIRRDTIISDATQTPLQRAQAHADFYAAVRLAYAEGLTTPEIQTAAQLSRQRVYQILRTPRTSRPAPATTVQLPETDL